MQKFLEGANIVAAFVPVDTQTAENAGDWVNLSKWGRVLCVLFKAAGIAGDDPVFTLNQAKDNAGGSAKALTFTDIWKKVGTQTGIASFTKVVQAAAGTYTDAASAEAQTIMAVEVKASDLDVANDFTHVQLVIPDTGAGGAQLGCAFYIMLDPTFSGSTLESAIA